MKPPRAEPTMNRTAAWARRFLPVWIAGLAGVASLLLQAPPPLLLQQAPALDDLPDLAIRALLLVNPLILVTAMAALGAATAHAAGLRSRLAGDREAPLGAGLALACGASLAVAITAADAALAGPLGEAWQRVAADAAAGPATPRLVIGLLYGGLAEEVLMRWGVMSAVVWALLRLRGGGGPMRPAAGAAWAGIVVAALVFAAGHLPALAQAVEPSGPIVARTLALNALAGLVYGWLYWRRSLECAMLAHAATHAGFAVLGLLR